jgi:hypothetical protein
LLRQSSSRAPGRSSSQAKRPFGSSANPASATATG